jgi:hypothetical protein
VEPVLEGGGDPEVPPAAAQPPEQLRLGLRVDAEPPRVGGDQLDGAKVVHGQAEPAHQVPEAAAEGQPADPGVAHDPGRDGQPEPLGRAVQLPQQHPTGRADRTGGGIDPDGPHRRQVDHQPAVAHRLPGHRVPAATRRHQQVVLPGEADRLDHVVGAGAAGDQRRPPVDRPVPDTPRLLVPLLAGPEQRAPEAAAQPRQRLAPDHVLPRPDRRRYTCADHSLAPSAPDATDRWPRAAR